ncbi:MAG: hypothetical protein V1910_01190 [bacterium]
MEKVNFWGAVDYIIASTDYDDEENVQAFLSFYAVTELGVEDIAERLNENLFVINKTLVEKFQQQLRLAINNRDPRVIGI